MPIKIIIKRRTVVILWKKKPFNMFKGPPPPNNPPPLDSSSPDSISGPGRKISPPKSLDSSFRVGSLFNSSLTPRYIFPSSCDSFWTSSSPEHSWFSGSLCLEQKDPPQYPQLYGSITSFPHSSQVGNFFSTSQCFRNTF